MIIGAADYSYTCPALCIVDTDCIKSSDDIKTFSNFKFFAAYEDTRKNRNPKVVFGIDQNVFVEYLPSDYTTPEERFRNIKEWAARIFLQHKVEEVVFEGFAMGSRVGMIFQIAENASVLKQWLSSNGIPFTIPSPAHVKKTFTGKGNAKKPQMVAVFNKLFSMNISLDVFGVDDSPKMSKITKNKPLSVLEEQDPVRPIADIVDAFANLVTHKQLIGKYEIPSL